MPDIEQGKPPAARFLKNDGTVCVQANVQVIPLLTFDQNEVKRELSNLDFSAHESYRLVIGVYKDNNVFRSDSSSITLKDKDRIELDVVNTMVLLYQGKLDTETTAIILSRQSPNILPNQKNIVLFFDIKERPKAIPIFVPKFKNSIPHTKPNLNVRSLEVPSIGPQRLLINKNSTFIEIYSSQKIITTSFAEGKISFEV